MKNILVAVDFSDTSLNALYYATNLASLLEARLTALHVISTSMPTESGIIAPANSIAFKAAADRLDYFVDKLPSEKGVELANIKINKKIEAGPPAFSIPNYAEDMEADLIIMGTIDKSTIFSRMIGSVTTATINNSSCPVLLIHRNTQFLKPRKIVFAIDHTGNLDDSLEIFNKLNNKMQNYTEFVHVKGPSSEPMGLVKSEIIHELVEEENANYSFEVKEIDGNNPSQDIIDYCIFSKSDMLVLVHHEINWFKRLFKGSTSFKTAENIHLPVLIIPDD